MNKLNNKRLLHKNSIQPNDFIERFCNRLNIEEKYIHEVKKICNIVMENNITIENTPPSIASGCIFYFIKEKKLEITKKEISDICKISEVTINKCTKKIEHHRELFHK